MFTNFKFMLRWLVIALIFFPNSFHFIFILFIIFHFFSTHKIGHVATYPGGGYPQILGTSYFETLTIIQDLKAKGWVDLLTRAVIIEFSLYSAGTDMTAMVAMLAEFPLTGGVITSYEIQSQKLMWFQSRHVDPLMVLQVS